MRRALTAVAVAVLVLSILPASTDAAPASRYRLNLFRSGDFVSQVTSRTCVGASIQMMVNIGGPDDRTRKTQLRFWDLARDLSSSRWGGTNARGWAEALTDLGEGTYVVDSRDDLRLAVTKAARVIRQTGSPVGLLVWHGAHAWVMHGFEATADPLVNPLARVTAVYVSDPWYPRVSSTYGPSAPPNARLTVAQLGRDFLPWKRRHPNPEKDGRFFLVLPFLRPFSLSGPGP